MRAAALLAVALVLGLGSGLGCGHRRLDSVELAHRDNARRFAEDAGQRAAARFLVEMMEARMAGIQQSRLAASRAVHEDVRAYGERMLQDQQTLLSELRALASEEGVTLPEQLGDDRADALAALEQQRGARLDQQYLARMAAGHRHDVRAFEAARGLEVLRVRDYAVQRLPLIEEHLRQAEILASRY